MNPAALARVEATAPSEVAVGYDALLDSAYSGSIAYARPLGRGAFAAGLIYAAQDSQTAYNSTGDSTGKFTPADIALGAWYAQQFIGSISLVGGLKIIHSALAERSGTTAAVDLGLLAKHISDIGNGPFDAGFSISNIGPPLKLGNVADPLPARIRAGGLWRPSPTFDAGLDINVPVDADPYIALGVEARFPVAKAGLQKPWIVSVRSGYDQNRTRGIEGFSGLSAGVGFDFSALRLDYSWAAFGDVGAVNRITVAFRF